MAEIRMPQLGESVTEGTITRWFKQVGDHVNEDEPLFEVSTDKVDSEVPSPASGVIAEILVPEGATVDVGTVLVVLADSAESTQPAEPAQPAEAAQAAEPAAPPPPPATEPSPPPPPAAAPQAPPTPPPPSGTAAGPAGTTDGRLLSPLVRRLIIEHGLDPDQIPGTGVGGRITREDVLDAIDRRAAARSPAAPPAPEPPAPGAAQHAPQTPPSAPQPPPTVAEEPTVPTTPETSSSPTGATASPPAPPATVSVAVTPVGADTIEKLSNIRLRTGEHMLRSRATSPHAITAIDVDYEAVERARKPLRAQFRAEEGFSLTYLPFIARAVIDALSEYPHMNATVGDGELIVHNYVNLSIAVDLDFQGLLAPVIKGADGKRLRAIAREIHDLAERARSKRLVPDDLAGGTFTLSNSGSYGTFFVAPIINQPQVAILSTDGIRRRPVVVELPDGTESIAIHSVGNLTMSWDHRAFDGAYAAAFLARVKEIIETRDWTAEL